MSSPIRMCIACRMRFPKNTLLRLQYHNQKLIAFCGEGRSFYLCKECSTKPQSLNSLARICKIDKKNRQNLSAELKEILIHGESPYQRDC